MKQNKENEKSQTAQKNRRKSADKESCVKCFIFLSRVCLQMMVIKLP